jgi:hypothetical protein
MHVGFNPHANIGIVHALDGALQPLGVFGGEGRGGGAVRGSCGATVEGVLLAASVGIALSPSARVVVLLKSDFLAYYC